MRVIHYVLMPLLVATSASVAAAQKVNVDYTHTTDFSQYKTFYDTCANQWPNAIQQQRAQAMLDSTLQAKGWTKAPNAMAAQVLVVMLVSSKEQQSVNTMYSGGGGWGGYRWGGGAGYATTTTSTYTNGTLLVDMYDLKTKDLFWRATATAEISDKAENNTKKIYNSFKKMFDKFPPPPDKKD